MKKTAIYPLILFLGAAATSPAQSLLEGLRVYYDFEESGAAGLANKAPGATGLNATRHGGGTFDSSANPSGPGFAGNPAFNPGNGDSDRSTLLAGNALNLVDTRADAIIVPVANTDLGTSFTISVWHALTPSGGSVARPFVFEQANDNYNISWGIGSGDSYTAYVTTASLIGGNVLARNVWHHVAHVFESDGTTTTLRLYINGELIGTRTGATASLTFNGINFGRARNNAGGRDWDGMMDEIALWNRALDETEILRIHALGLQGQPLTGAVERFWDINGETAGAGGSSPSGLWSDANWNSDPAGAGATGNWTPGAVAVLAAGDDATGPYAITLKGADTAAAVIARTGTPTLTGGTLALEGLHLLSTRNSAALTVQSALQTPRLITSGSITLAQPVTVAGPLDVLAGPLSLPAGASFGGLTGTGTGTVGIGGTLALTPATGATAAFTGALDGTGTLRMAGPGTQTLIRQADGFDGAIEVAGGTLALSGVIEHAGGVLVSGGLLVAGNNLPSPVVVGAAGTLAAGTSPVAPTPVEITLGDGSSPTLIDGTLRFKLNGGNDLAGGGVNDLMRVPGNVAFGAGSVISPSFSGILFAGNTYSLVEVNGTRTGLPVIDPAVQARYRYHLALGGGDSYPDDLVLAVSGTPADLTWVGDGVANVWQAGGPANWTYAGSPSAFLIPDYVDFNDTGDTSQPVRVTGEVMPSSIVVDADTKDYVWAGDGVVAGGGGLDKYGSAQLTLLNRNEFTGAVRILEGGVTVGNGGTTGTLGGSGDIQVSAGAFLTYDRSDFVNPGRRVIGGGTLVHAGSGTLRTGQAGNNADIIIGSGTFQALEGAWATSYFSTANRQIVVNGGTLVTFTHSLGGLGGAFNRPDVTINAGGTWQLNAEQYMNAGDLILNGGTILITAVNLRLQGGTMTVGESAGGSRITRTGSGFVTLFANPTFDIADGPAAVDFEIAAPISQDGTHGIIKNGPGVMRLSANNSFTGGATINEGTLQLGDGVESGSPGTGAILNNATLEIIRSDAPTLANAISGTGTLAIKGGGTVTLAGANTYTGHTTVVDGTLVLGTGGQLAFALTGTSANSVSGSGSAAFNGSFQLELTGADPTDGNTWPLATVADQSFGAAFSLTSNAGAFAKSGALHTLVADGRTWTFDESTGTLTVNDGIILAGGASLKLLDGTEAGTGTLTLNGGNLWLGEAVEVANDIVLVGPAAGNVFGGTVPVDYLAVGGGGGGGARDSAGGGGGGAVLSNLITPGFHPLVVAPGEAIPLAVGDGGVGGIGPDGSGTTRGQQGQSSQFGAVVAPGGGGGGGYASTGGNGASGGGGGRNSAGGIGTSGHGFNGGAGAGGTTTGHPGGGGGGAGQAGQQGILNTKGGNGGDGLPVPMIPASLAADLRIGEISGSNVYFGGGGGGTGHRTPTTLAPGIGGLGGGGDGAERFTAPVAVAANTGGGGGAARSDSSNAAISSGAKGGSGLVVVRYPGSAKATGGSDTRGVDGFTYHTFTSTGGDTLAFGAFAGTASATMTGTLSGSGGFTWNSSGSLTLTAANTYSGDTVVNSGTLVLQQATLADGSAVFLNGGATLNLPHGQTDSVAALWINGVQQPAGTYHSGNTGGAITGTGSLQVTTDPAGGFAAWIGGFFPGETDPAIVGPHADPNGDGVANALVYLFGGDPKDGNNLTLLPTATLATNPGGTVPNGDYLVFTYRRDVTAQVTATVEHSTALTDNWAAATHGQGGVVIVETPNGFASGIDRVEVLIPRSGTRMFARLGAALP